ncbi:MAG TPA: GAF domain-containing protein, partial [Anaerolineae bacterium]|nr:GAF domain-containing protein [Anaerolineae bacterium]
MARRATEGQAAASDLFKQIGHILVSSLGLDTALGGIVDQALAVIDADVALVRLLDRPGQQLTLQVARGVPPEAVRELSFAPGEGLAGRVLLDGQPLRGLNLQHDPRTRHQEMARRHGWQSFVAVAIHLHRQPIGIWLLIRHRREAFSDHDLELLSTLADYASLAIERSWLLHTIVQEKHESEAVIDASASGILVVDPYGHIVNMNPALEQLTGWQLPQVRGELCCDIVGCRDSGEGTEEMPILCPLRLERVEERAFVEYRIRTRAGRWVPVEASYGLVHDEAGELARVVIVFRDITHQEERNRARAEFVANVSHELRTPLALIKGYATTLLSPGVFLDDDKTRRFMQNVNSAADRLSWMIDDLLCASRLDAEELHLRPQPFDLCLTIRKVLSWFQPHAPRKEMVAELPGAGLWVRADPDRVEQVLLNLLTNAARYSGAGTRITVKARLLGEPPRAVVHVVDQGIGIAPEHLPR